MNTFYHSGDLGDIIASLQVVLTMGGGQYWIGPHQDKDIKDGGPREVMDAPRTDFIAALIAKQPYVVNCSRRGRKGCTHDFSLMRLRTEAEKGETLANRHARSILCEDPLTELPWLTAIKNPETEGKIVFSRSPRYHNDSFPWKKIVKQCRGQSIFIGTPDDHGEFENDFGPIPYRRVNDALEMASLIKGSKLFVGNQSFPCWVAMGLGHPVIQETCEYAPDSIVRRPGSLFFGHPDGISSIESKITQLTQ